MATAIIQGGNVHDRIRLLNKIAPQDSFERKYLSDVRPKLESEFGFEYVEEHDRTMCRLALWRGDFTPMADISEKWIVEFEAWLRTECRIGEKTIGKYGRDIRRIVRMIDPAQCRGRVWKGGNAAPGNKRIVDPSADPGTIRHFFESVYKPRRLRGKSARTLQLYANTFRNFARYVGREPLLTDLNEDILAGFLGWHLDRGHSPETANKDGGQLMSIARYAFKKRVLEIEPELVLLTCPRRAPLAWMMDELHRLFDVVDNLPGREGLIPARLWWRALLLTCYYTGERISALMALKWEHFNLQAGWVFVPAELRKGKRADKQFELPAVVISALRELEKRKLPDDSEVFSFPVGFGMLYRRLKAIHRRAGLPTDRRSMFHRMRRTAASWYKAKGGDPSQLLDHADPKTTARYIDLRICQTKSAAALLDDPTGPLAIGGAQ